VGSCPDLVPLAAGLLAAQGEDAGGAGLGPAHAGEFEALADDSLNYPPTLAGVSTTQVSGRMRVPAPLSPRIEERPDEEAKWVICLSGLSISLPDVLRRGTPAPPRVPRRVDGSIRA
jgi:hypothetical protein